MTRSVDGRVHLIGHVASQGDGSEGHPLNRIFDAPDTDITDVRDLSCDPVGDASDQGASSRDDDVVSEDRLVFRIRTGDDLLDTVRNLWNDHQTSFPNQIPDIDRLTLPVDGQINKDLLRISIDVGMLFLPSADHVLRQLRTGVLLLDERLQLLIDPITSFLDRDLILIGWERSSEPTDVSGTCADVDHDGSHDLADAVCGGKWLGNDHDGVDGALERRHEIALVRE